MSWISTLWYHLQYATKKEGSELLLIKLSLVVAQDQREIWWYSLTTPQKRNFSGVLTNGKLTGIRVLNAKGAILKKINVLFIVHLRLGNTVLDFILFWKHLVQLSCSKKWRLVFKINQRNKQQKWLC